MNDRGRGRGLGSCQGGCVGGCTSITIYALALRSLMPLANQRGGCPPSASCRRRDGSPGTYTDGSPERCCDPSNPQPSAAECSQDQSAIWRARGADSHGTQEPGQAQGHFRRAMNHTHSSTGSLRSPRPAPAASHRHTTLVSIPPSGLSTTRPAGKGVIRCPTFPCSHFAAHQVNYRQGILSYPRP